MYMWYETCIDTTSRSSIYSVAVAETSLNKLHQLEVLLQATLWLVMQRQLYIQGHHIPW